MSLDPYRLPYRAPILEDLPASLLFALPVLPLRDVLRLSRAAPIFRSEDPGDRPGGRALLYVPTRANLELAREKGHGWGAARQLVESLGWRRALALADARGGGHWTAPLESMPARAVRIRQAFDLLDMGAGDLQAAQRLAIGASYARDLEDALAMWREGSDPAAIRQAGGCSPRVLALVLAHDLNRPGGVPAGLAPLPPPRLPPLESLPGDLPELVAAVGMRDALTLTHIREAMGKRAAERLADSLGVARLKPPALRDLAAALRARHALDLWQLGYTPEEINATTNPQGGGLKGWLRAAAAWRQGADLAEAAKAGGVAPSRLALTLWREW